MLRAKLIYVCQPPGKPARSRCVSLVSVRCLYPIWLEGLCKPLTLQLCWLWNPRRAPVLHLTSSSIRVMGFAFLVACTDAVHPRRKSPPPPIKFASPPPMRWRVSNAGALTWGPGVDLAFFGDVACTASIAIPADGGWPDAASACPSTGCALCSGWDAVVSGTDGTKGCHLALDGNPSIGIHNQSGTWRPGKGSSGTKNYWSAGEVWMEIRFASDPGIACVKASYMGKGGGGGRSWNGGLTVQTSVDGVTYFTRERDEDAASTYNLDANYFPVLIPPSPGPRPLASRGGRQSNDMTPPPRVLNLLS